MSAHQMSTIEEFCSDILILNKGKTVLQGNLREIKESYPANRVKIETNKNIDEYVKKLELEIEGLPIITAKKYISGKKLSKKVELALEDLEQNHNNSWAVEMYNRNKDNLDNIALYYRGNKINYGKLFEESYKYAKALKQMGYNKDNEVPICISNIPEFVYILTISFI